MGLFGGSIALGVLRSRGASTPPPEENERLGKLIGIWSSVEGLAIFVAINVLTNTHHDVLILGAVCTIVGLHFFPLARGIPVKLYYLSGIALTMLGMIGLAFSGVVTPTIVAFGAAAILWGTLAIVLTARRAAQPV